MFEQATKLKNSCSITFQLTNEEDNRFLKNFPYAFSNYLYNLLFLKLMVVESPAISAEFFYVLHYYGEEALSKIFGLDKHDISSLFLYYLKYAYKSKYRLFGQFRYPEIIKFFKKHGFSSVNLNLFIREINNLEDIPGLKKDWAELISRLIKIIRVNGLITNEKAFSKDAKRLLLY